MIDRDVEEVVETYFRQCSTLVTCRDLATMAATLASTGVNPVTGERVVREDTVRNVLSVMASCGMYDAAGDWLYTVGLPAKSGVAGGIIAVLPGQLGVAVYSPPLDLHGNSVRGVKVCEDLSDELHLDDEPGRRPPPPVRIERTCIDSRSKRLRGPAEQQILAEHGRRVKVLELEGELSFAAGELVTSSALHRAEHHDFTVLDFRAVRAIDLIDVPIFSHLVESCEEAGSEIAFSDVDRHPVFLEEVDPGIGKREGHHPLRTFPDLDLALEWCEQGLIEKYGDLDPTRNSASPSTVRPSA